MSSTPNTSLALGNRLLRRQAAVNRGARASLSNTETWTLAALHAIERVGAGIGLLVLAPMAAVLAGAIFILSGQSPLVRHRRVGVTGRPLWMLKFRSMWPESVSARVYRLVDDVTDSVPFAKSHDDVRVTSDLAAFCRRYSLDEVPQLWHVVRGEMSLVGPRPITALELQEHYGSTATEVLEVLPGIAGLWQTMGRNRLTYPQRRRLDLFYARRASAGLYLRILWRAVPAVLRGTGAC